MACTNCEPCSGRSIKDGAVTPVALFCDLTSASGCKSPAVNWQIVCDATGARFYAVNLVCDGVLPGTLTYYDLNLVAATPTLPVDLCSGGKLDIEIQTLCDDTLNDGTAIVQFLRIIVFNNVDGTIVSIVDKTINGAASYSIVGSVTNCGSSTEIVNEQACIKQTSDNTIVATVEIVKVVNKVTGAIISLRVFSTDGLTEYTLPLPAGQVLGSCEEDVITDQEICISIPQPALTDDWTGATLAGNTATNANFAGTGQTVTFTNSAVPASIFIDSVVLDSTNVPNETTLITYNLGAPRKNVTIEVVVFGTTGGETITNVSPVPTSVTGAATLVGNSVLPTTSDGTAFLHFNGPVQIITFTWGSVAGVNSRSHQTNITFDNEPLEETWTRLTLANGTVKYVDSNGVIQTSLPVGATVINCKLSPNTIEVVCRCDDTDNDGVGETSYKEIISITPKGVVTVLATYNRTMTTPYTPVSPVDCTIPGDNLIQVTPGYKLLSGVGLWTLNADSVAPTVSVTFTVITVGNSAIPPTVTTYAGTSGLAQGQSVTWSATYSRDVSGLKPPLVLTTNAGDIVAVLWTSES